jgi:hypothetical protein
MTPYQTARLLLLSLSLAYTTSSCSHEDSSPGSEDVSFDFSFQQNDGTTDTGSDISGADTSADLEEDSTQDMGNTDTETDTSSHDMHLPDSLSDADLGIVLTEGGGSFTVQIEEGDFSIAVRVFYPDAENSRYAEGAPILVQVPGGHSPGSLDPEAIKVETVEHGYIIVQYLMPGGRSPDGAISTGEFDYRLRESATATGLVLLYAQGQLTDSEGATIQDSIEHALTDHVGIVGLSNGGNLAIMTAVSIPESFESIRWLITWESPIGDQYVTVDLGGNNQLNPLYVPGTCDFEMGCPLGGLEELLRFDDTVTYILEDNATDTSLELEGVFYADINRNDLLDEDDFRFNGLAGPGEVFGEIHYPKLYLSDNLSNIISEIGEELFGGPPPTWLADVPLTAEYWKAKDALPNLRDFSALFRALPIMVLGSLEDHVQGQPDHPHILTFLQGLAAHDHQWFRLNPDSAYQFHVDGGFPFDYPDNIANTVPTYPGIDSWLALEPRPDSVPNAVIQAAVLEMMDRANWDDWSSNLENVMIP